MRTVQRSIAEVTGFVSVMVIAALTRLWNLVYPSKLVFDETYYVKDALTLSVEGHEKSWPDGADAAFQSGDVFGYLGQAAFVVHPPLGKWLIASGIWLAGPDQSTGWRLSTAILGIATVGLLMLVALKLFRSVPVAILAGLLLAIDGLAITLSRTALLDTSLTFFLLLGFWFFLFDQQSSRVKITRAIERSENSILWLRPWLILTGIALGAASSIKWSGLYLLAGIGLYVVVSESLLRKNSGESNWLRKGFLFQGVFSFLSLIPAAAATYLLTWMGWILGTGGYLRNWATENPASGIFALFPDWMLSLWRYHEMIYGFHVNLTKEHSYEAHPLGWLVGVRPTAFFYESYPLGTNGCEIADGCSSAITALGNPFIWISSTAALIYIIYRYARHRERVLGLVLLGTASLYLPWIILSGRTVFQFYVVSFQPWLILGLVLAIQQLRRRIVTKSKTLANMITVGFVSLVFGAFLFFLPVNTGMYLPFELWQLRMWLPSWI
jgi:dolichyl-phosphate-mannose--protein O-mannosyl transferase